MTIGERISNKRIELGYSQEDLAKKCGWNSRSSISKIESSGDKISLKKIEVVAKALNVTTAYLMGWDDESDNLSEYIGIEDIEKSMEKFDLSQLKRIMLYAEYLQEKIRETKNKKC